MRKVITLIVVVVLLIINFNLLKGSYESAQKLKEINVQEDKVKLLQEKNLSLKDKLKQADSSFYIEQQARDKLDYSKNGETIIIVENQNIAKSGESQKTETSKSNLEKWVELVRN